MLYVEVAGKKLWYMIAEDDEKVAHFPWEQDALDAHFAGGGETSATETVDDGCSVSDDDSPPPDDPVEDGEDHE